MDWPTFSQQTLDLWGKAFEAAEEWASQSSRIIPLMIKETHGLAKPNRRSRQVGFLKPGTIVWTSVENYPVSGASW